MVQEESYRQWAWMPGRAASSFCLEATERRKTSLKILDQKKTSAKLVQTVWKPGRTSSMSLGGLPPTPTTIALTTEVSGSPPPTLPFLQSTGLHLDPGHVAFPYTCNPSPASSVHRPRGHQHGPCGLETRAPAYLPLTLHGPPCYKQMNRDLPNTQTLYGPDKLPPVPKR